MTRIRAFFPAHMDADKETTIEIDYDATGERILRIKVKYLRYSLDADFVRGEAVLKVDIFLEEEI